MDLERMFQNAGSMDAQNTTLFLLSLIAQLGKTQTMKGTTNNTSEDGDSDILLNFNIGDLLMKYYKYDPNFWATVVTNLVEEKIRRMENTNRRLRPTTSTVLISFYVRPILPYISWI